MRRKAFTLVEVLVVICMLLVFVALIGGAISGCANRPTQVQGLEYNYEIEEFSHKGKKYTILIHRGEKTMVLLEKE